MRLRMVVPLTLALCAPGAALATNTTVPDQYATIQGAINAGTDTVYVRDGDYPEALTARPRLQLMSLRTVGYWGETLGMPRVKSMSGTIVDPGFGVAGFRFSDPVTIKCNYGYLRFDGCWFGSGLKVNGGANGHVWNCVVMGSDGLDLTSCSMDVAMNTVIGGTVIEDPPGGTTVHDNVVIGSNSPGTGIYCWSDLSAARNYVRGYVNGIQGDVEASAVTDNVIEDCTGAGIKANRAITSYPISGNTISHTWRGIDLTILNASGYTGGGTVSGNTIKSPAAEGIYSAGALFGRGSLLNNTVLSPGGMGIDATASFNTLVGNRVIDAGGDGIVFVPSTPDYPTTVTGNVVGHAHGRGIAGATRSTGGPNVFRNNTAHDNVAAGYDLAGFASDSVDHNIAYGNGGAGLKWTGAAPAIGCNDWFANSGPATSGVAAGASDVTLDPLFCNDVLDDVGLQSGSPLAALAGCGQVGALGVGCAVAAVSPGPNARTGTLGLSVMPTPSRGAVRFGWSAPAKGGEIAVFDVSGERRWGRKLEGTQGELAWEISGPDGRPLAPGVYFARLTAGGHSTTRRVVLVP